MKFILATKQLTEKYPAIYHLPKQQGERVGVEIGYMNALCDQHQAFLLTRAPGAYTPRASTAAPLRLWCCETQTCSRHALSIATAAARTQTYPATLARHWSAARDGSLILFWANWSQWPAGQTLSNLKFLAHLVQLPHFRGPRTSLDYCKSSLFAPSEGSEYVASRVSNRTNSSHSQQGLQYFQITQLCREY